MASKQYEMLFKLGARLGENFKGTFNSAQKILDKRNLVFRLFVPADLSLTKSIIVQILVPRYLCFKRYILPHIETASI